MNKEAMYTEYMKELAEALENSENKAMMYTSFTTSSCNSNEVGDPEMEEITMEIA